jgi:hypothetical protein
MANYDQIRAYFQQSEALQAAVRRAASVPLVQGFTLDVDPLWSLFYDIENGLADWPTEDGSRTREWRELFDHPHLLFRYAYETDFLYRLRFRAAHRYQGYRSRDLRKEVKSWTMLQEELGSRRSSPMIMTVVHRPLRGSEQEGRNEESDDQAQLRTLVGLIRESAVPVRLEERPVARLAFAAGDGIQSTNKRSGTLGGVLQDSRAKKSYGVTCAHVAASGDTLHDSSGALVGSCTADTAPVALTSGTVCDPVNLAVPNPSPGNGPDLNMLDSALIDLAIPITMPQLAGVAKSLSPGQNVTIRGASTGITRHRLGSLCLSYSFNQGGQDFCFRDAIEIWPVSWAPFGGFLGQMMSTVPTQGDSGAWVLTDDQPAYWAGVFFGEDGYRGFAIRGSWVHSWAEKSVGSSLTV